MSRPNIAFLCTSSAWGGLEMNVLRLAIWLKARGWEILTLTQENSPLYISANQRGIRVEHLRPSFKYGDLPNASQLKNLIRKHDIGIVVLHERRDIMLGAFARILNRNKLKLIYMQNMHIGVNKRDPYHTWLYSHLDAWIVPLNLLKERLLLKTRFDPNRVHVIPFGIEIERFTAGLPEKKMAREKLNLPLDAAIVGVIGRLDPEKCQETLIKAVRILHQDSVEIHCLIVGDETRDKANNYRLRLENLAREFSISDRVHIRRAMSEIQWAYAALDFFALTSKSETYGMVTIEAMASGLPVIGTCHGGTREIIRHEQSGLLIEREDERELADAIKRLLNDRKFAQQIGEQGARDAIANYSHFRQCELLEKLFASGRSDNS